MRNCRLGQLIHILVAAALLDGCASDPVEPAAGCQFDGSEDRTPLADKRARVAQLTGDLLNLSPAADLQEARTVAEVTLQSSIKQRQDYDITSSSPSAHNLLVVQGLKKRGLCIHWTRDLLDTLRALHLQTYTLFWGIANEGNLIYEHSTVVIAARGASFEQGMVLDGWRHSGCLYWGSVKTDKYQWKQAAHYEDTVSR
ncbi:MAG: hypothetical protein U1F34_04325 [Gammaproteobacteria bacterium]